MLTRVCAITRHLKGARMTMSTISGTIHNTNTACCTIPPVKSDYTPKGSFKPHGVFNKVYVTGPEDSQNKVVCIYDIFGYFPQTQQGADIIASSLNATVYMPDFFEPGKPFPPEKYPPKTDQDKEEIQKFFGGAANPGAAVAKLASFGRSLKESGARNVGAYGFCWGGKVSFSAGGESSPFTSVAIVHPAMLSSEDATKLTVPLAIYISKDEPVSEYDKITEIIAKNEFSSKNDYKNYSNMFHGWAAARGNLDDPENKREFEDVYARLVDFFRKTFV